MSLSSRNTDWYRAPPLFSRAPSDLTQVIIARTLWNHCLKCLEKLNYVFKIKFGPKVLLVISLNSQCFKYPTLEGMTLNKWKLHSKTVRHVCLAWQPRLTVQSLSTNQNITGQVATRANARAHANAKKANAWFSLTLPKSNLIANKENLFKIPFIKWAIFILAASVFRDFNNAKHLMDQKFYVMIYQTRETVFYQALLDTVH